MLEIFDVGLEMIGSAVVAVGINQSNADQIGVLWCRLELLARIIAPGLHSQPAWPHFM